MGPHYDDEDFEPEILADGVRAGRRESNTLIAAKVGTHLCIPVSQRQSHIALEDKAASSTHWSGIDSKNVAHLQRELDLVISDRTDTGVEDGMAEFHLETCKIDELLPP